MAHAAGTVADLIAGTLAAAGVRTLFGVPGGGGNLEIIDAAARAGVPFVLTATETAAALAAVGQAEASGGCGACLTTLGPGVSSVANGVACAFLDRAPILVFTDSYPESARDVEHQRIDHRGLMAPITKQSVVLAEENAAALLHDAVATARCGRPGPVHIDCPGDVAAAPAGRNYPGVDDRAPQPAGECQIDTGFDAVVARARRPVLIAGLGARGRTTANAIRRLCAAKSVPALVTYKAKGVVPDDDPWYGGVFTNGRLEQPLIDGSDLLIGVGLDPVELIPRPWRRAQPTVACGRWRVDDKHVPFAAQHIGDIGLALERIGAMITSEWAPDVVGRHVDAQREAIRVPTGGLSAQRVVEIAADRLRSAAHVAVDAGAHMFPSTVLWRAREPGEMLISNGLSTMGFALPAAIGAALSDRHRTVAVLTGDGGLLMCVGELLTAVRERLRVVTVVFSDRSLSLIEIKQQAKRLSANGVALGDIVWPQLARSVGMAAFAAETERELIVSLDEAMACGRPALVEARIDRGHYAATLRAVRG